MPYQISYGRDLARELIEYHQLQIDEIRKSCIFRHGSIIAHMDILEQIPSNAFKIRSWMSGRGHVWRKEFYDYIGANNLVSESVLDPHELGHKYIILVYRDPKERQACYDVLNNN